MSLIEFARDIRENLNSKPPTLEVVLRQHWDRDTAYDHVWLVPYSPEANSKFDIRQIRQVAFPVRSLLVPGDIIRTSLIRYSKVAPSNKINTDFAYWEASYRDEISERIK